VDRAEERFDDREAKLRDLARERGRRRLPRIMRKAESIFSPRGFYPQDAKPIFDPVDFVIFDGMNQTDSVRRVVLFDGPPDSRSREKLQRTIGRTVRQGNYEWRTVRLSKQGKIGVLPSEIS